MPKIYFLHGPNCRNCDNLKQQFVTHDLIDKVEFVDVSDPSGQGRELIDKYGVRGIPTLLKIRKGRKGEDILEDALVGYKHNIDRIKTFLEV